MLTFTCIWTGIVYNTNSLLVLVYTNIWLFYVCLVGMIATSCALMAYYEKFRAVPINYIMLTLYTVFHTYIVAAIVPMYEPSVVISAALCTWGMFVALTGYACFTKTDMTKKGGLLSTATMMVFMFMLLAFVFNFAYLRVVLVIVVILLMSMWVVHDT